MLKLIQLMLLTMPLAALQVQAAYAEDGVIRIGATLKINNKEGEQIGQMLASQFDLINKNGGLGGHKIQLTILNDECKTDVGVSNALKLISDIKVHLLITQCSAVTIPIIDLSNRAKVPQISPTSASDVTTNKGSAWIFRFSVADRFNKSVLGEYIAENLGKKIAYLTSRDASAQSFTKGIISIMKSKYKADPVFVGQANEQDIDYRSYLLKIKAAQPDAILLSANDYDLAKMIIQANEVGIPASIPRVGNTWACTNTFPNLVGENAVGLVFVCPMTPFDERPNVQAFVKDAAQRYNVDKPDEDFMQTYDMVQLLAKALGEAKLKLTDESLAADRETIRDTLASIKDYRGLSAGPIGYCADPTPQCRDGNRTPYLMQYTKGGSDYSAKVLKSITYDASAGL